MYHTNCIKSQETFSCPFCTQTEINHYQNSAATGLTNNRPITTPGDWKITFFIVITIFWSLMMILVTQLCRVKTQSNKIFKKRKIWKGKKPRWVIPPTHSEKLTDFIGERECIRMKEKQSNLAKAGSRMHFVFIFIVFEWKYNYFRMLKIAPSATKVAVRTFFRRSVSSNPIIFFTNYFISRVFFERYLVFNSNWKPMKLNSCD